MKRAGWMVAGLVIAALNWAALHDILKGNEPDLLAEYTVVILTGLGLIGFLIARVARSGGKQAHR